METWEVTFEEKQPEQLNQSTSNNWSNVNKTERLISAIGGGALVGYALTARSKTGIILGVLGAGLLYRGATGHCDLYGMLGINTAEKATAHDEEVARDVHIEKSITINSTPAELYKFWRDFENLPRFMKDLERVTVLDNNRSHWVAKGPGGKNVEWDAEIYNEKEGELIAWRSMPDADITNAGSVHFEPAPDGRGTVLKVVLNYNPPGGKAAALFAKLFGSEPGQLVEENLKRFKQLMEAGEISTTEGQPSGREKETETSTRKENKLASKTPVNTLSRAAKEGAA
jgi:uncharacterized membrane protein